MRRAIASGPKPPTVPLTDAGAAVPAGREGQGVAAVAGAAADSGAASVVEAGSGGQGDAAA